MCTFSGHGVQDFCIFETPIVGSFEDVFCLFVRVSLSVSLSLPPFSCSHSPIFYKEPKPTIFEALHGDGYSSDSPLLG